MDIINSIILGIVQGATEFLPISSSGHLIIARDILGIQTGYGLSVDAVLQLATTLAVLLYFWKDILGYIETFFRWIFRKSTEERERILLLAIIVGTIPAIFFGFFLEEIMDTVFRNSSLVAFTLIFGSLIMIFAEKRNKRLKEKDQKLTVKKGLFIGLFQSLALIPGMSRSGMTISGGLANGLSREEATRFSFLLAFPVLFGSGLKKLLDLYNQNILIELSTPIFIGSLTAFVVGLAAIHFLVTFLKKNTMNVFVWYRVIVAALILFIL